MTDNPEGLRKQFQTFLSEPFCWTPQTISRIPIPQLASLWLWDEMHGIRRVSLEEGIALLEARRKANDATTS